MFRFETKFEDGRVRQALDGLAESMSPAMRRTLLLKIGSIYLANAESRFKFMNEPSGARWPSLQPSTIAYKTGKEGGGLGAGTKTKSGKASKGYGPTHIGVFRGKLATSLGVRVQGLDTVLVGTNVAYAKFFQQGASKGAHGFDRRGRPIPWGPVPPRPFLGTNKATNTAVLEMMNRFFSTNLFDTRKDGSFKNL